MIKKMTFAYRIYTNITMGQGYGLTIAKNIR